METTKIVYDICRHYLRDNRSLLDASLYDEGLGFLRSRRYDLLASWFDSRVHDLTRTQDARILLQVSSFFKKNDVFTDPYVAKLQALTSFEDAEEQCRLTNERLDTFVSDLETFPEFRSKVESCQRYIARVLGEFPDFLGKLPKLVRVTSGATATRSRKSALPFMKVSMKPVCTPGALPYLQALSDYYGYGKLAGKLVSKNRVEFVAKDWRTLRTIACEAEGNIPLQLAFDTYTKRRLRRKTRIDLSDQSQNQEQARLGSISNTIATVDEKSASDTTAYNTVALLFDMQWFNYLRAIRSQYFEIYPGSRESYHKFSSMGNGSTFAIETLVFAACCHSVGSKAFCVYGDDITIETELAADLIELLSFFGFMTNKEKTFVTGPYRESCGTHWFAGVDISPRFIRQLDDRKAILCHLVNTMVEVSTPDGSLQAYLVDLLRIFKLPLVPFNEDSLSGVWVTTHLAYERKVIRTSTKGKWAWRPRVRHYVPSMGKRSSRTSRAAFLWYLSTFSRRDPAAPLYWGSRGRYVSSRNFRAIISYLDRHGAYESSSYSTYSHKYVRKWVHWHIQPVANGTPDNVILFSELLSRES